MGCRKPGVFYLKRYLFIALRATKELSDYQVSVLMDMEPSTYWSIEHGYAGKYMNAAKLLMLANIFDVDV